MKKNIILTIALASLLIGCAKEKNEIVTDENDIKKIETSMGNTTPGPGTGTGGGGGDSYSFSSPIQIYGTGPDYTFGWGNSTVQLYSVSLPNGSPTHYYAVGSDTTLVGLASCGSSYTAWGSLTSGSGSLLTIEQNYCTSYYNGSSGSLCNSWAYRTLSGYLVRIYGNPDNTALALVPTGMLKPYSSTGIPPIVPID